MNYVHITHICTFKFWGYTSFPHTSLHSSTVIITVVIYFDSCNIAYRGTSSHIYDI